MKKLIFAFLMLAVFSSCEDEDHDVDVNNFNGPETSIFHRWCLPALIL